MSAKSWLAVLGLVVLAGPGARGQGAPDPVINEFLADNQTGLPDGNGVITDWIEILNPGVQTIDLEGYSLSDDPATPRKWVFPRNVLLAGQQLVVYASGSGVVDAQGRFHVNFRLAKEKGFLGLYDKAGKLVSSYGPDYPAQRADVSFGRSGGARPRLLVSSGMDCRWVFPKDGALGTSWTALEFDDAAWAPAKIGLGANALDSWRRFAAADLSASVPASGQMSVYARVPFEVTDPAALSNLRLRVRIADGFVVYLNGKRVADYQAPATAAWDATATRERDAPAAELTFELAPELPQLRVGKNVLAIHALTTRNARDFLLMPVLEATPRAPAVAVGYLQPTPQAPNGGAYLDFVKDTRLSHDHRLVAQPFDLLVTSATPDTLIRYTTDASPPSDSVGLIYQGPVKIAKTSVVRVMATKEDYLPTNIDTQTFLFPADVKRQKTMDPQVVDDPVYAPVIEKAVGEALPVVSLTVDYEPFFGTFGIYRQVERTGRGAEVPVTVEYFSPKDPVDSFRVNGGVRIHGGNARTHPKKPLRLLFREEYGVDRLRHRLFPGSPVDSFDELLLRSGGHDSWSLADRFGVGAQDIPPHATFLRDQFARKTENEIGILSPRGKYVSVYINGTYWGVYDLHERAAAAFFRDHRGGEEDDWDVIHHPEFINEAFVVHDGTAEAWSAMQKLCASAITTEADFNALKPYLDYKSFADHLITRMWTGDFDWLSPVFRRGVDVAYFSSKNWYAGRKSRNGAGPFHFFCWDAEMSMGSHLLIGVNQRIPDFDLTRIDDLGTPAAPYAALRGYDEFQRIFGDRIQRHFFGDGALTVARTVARLEELAAQLETPIVAESARWGNTGVRALFTRDDHWRPEVDWMKSTFLPQRHGEVVKQFRQRGLFPVTPAPTFAQTGGVVPAGQTISLVAPEGAGRIYYTTDGSDPAQYDKVARETWLGDNAEADYYVPTQRFSFLSNWNLLQGLPAPQLWKKGRSGFGFEVGDQIFKNTIKTDLAADMFGKNTAIYLRFNFDIPLSNVQQNLDRVLLRMKYDDGFIAYVNNQVLAASANPPVPPLLNFDSAAGATRASDFDALQFEDFDITALKAQFRPGRNLLSIFGLNADGSNDFLMSPRIEAIRVIEPAKPSSNAFRYSNGVTLNSSGTIKARVLSPSGEWSALAEAHFTVGESLKPGDLAVSEICYKPGPPNALEALAGPEREDFEFLELTNATTRDLDLTGAAFTQGITFTFPEMSLAPGAQVLVVKNRAAFRARYGNDPKLRVAGEFSFNSKLSDDGETLTLVSARGQTLLSFTYDDKAPWPAQADQEGRSLIFRGGATPDPKDPAQWAASLDPGGYPGTEGLARYSEWRSRYFGGEPDAVAAANRDADGDGWSNLFEYAFGSHPRRRDSWVNWSEFSPAANGQVLLYLRRRPATQDLTFEVEGGADLKAWRKLDLPVNTARTLEPSGHERVSIPVTDKSLRFARVLVR